MTEIERIIRDTLSELGSGGECCFPDLTKESQRKITTQAIFLAKAIEQYVIKARNKVLFDLVPNHLIIEKCLWFGRDDDSKREMRIEINHIDNDLNKPLDYGEAFKKAIAQLKKGLDHD